MISQPCSSMNSCTLASISRSRTPGFSHSYLIFHIAASPMLEACFSSSISSRVLTVRALETAGQPLTMFRPSFWKASRRRHVEIVDADVLLLDLVLLEHLEDAVGHAAGHVRHGALGPLPA